MRNNKNENDVKNMSFTEIWRDVSFVVDEANSWNRKIGLKQQNNCMFNASFVLQHNSEKKTVT